MKMGFVAWRRLQRGGIDFHEAFCLEPPPYEGCNARARQQPVAASGVTVAAPERSGVERIHEAPQGLNPIAAAPVGFAGKFSIRRAEIIKAA